jgi:hypothetical protein
VARARRHHRVLSLLAVAVLALAAEVVGRSLTTRIDVGRHVASPGYAGAAYYPFLLAAVKVGVALVAARLAWRFAKARSTARAAARLAEAFGHRGRRAAPRIRIDLSPALWLGSFALTAGMYLLQADGEELAAGDGRLFSPWLHSSALPVFAVLSVLVAALYRAVARWLADYETYAAESAALARGLQARVSLPWPRRADDGHLAPRRRFGISFESRPPPLPA